MSNYGMEYKIELTITLNVKPVEDMVVFVIASGKATISNIEDNLTTDSQKLALIYIVCNCIIAH